MESRPVIKIHFAFWAVVISVSLLDTFTYIDNKLFIPQLAGTFAIIIYNIITFYFCYSVISNGFLENKKYIKPAVTWLIYLSVTGFAVTYFTYYLFISTYPASVPVKFTHSEWVTSFIYGVMGIGTIYSLLGILSRLSLVWYRNKQKQSETEKQNLAIELAMLRAQVNPHFLFNTLNNIKSLVKSLPSKAVYSIEKLNGIMNYMLYESSLETVPFEKEIAYIKDYIELERIRYSSPEYISFTVNGDYSGVKIPPLIFMPFIENAFKHGNKLKEPPGIRISIGINNNEVNFFTKNYVKDNTETRIKNSGFGLKNIRRRLSLLFGSNYELKIFNENKEFSVNLKLMLP